MDRAEAKEFITALRAVAGVEYAQELAEFESAYKERFGELLPPTQTFEDSIAAALDRSGMQKDCLNWHSRFSSDST